MQAGQGALVEQRGEPDLGFPRIDDPRAHVRRPAGGRAAGPRRDRSWAALSRLGWLTTAVTVVLLTRRDGRCYTNAASGYGSADNGRAGSTKDRTRRSDFRTAGES